MILQAKGIEMNTLLADVLKDFKASLEHREMILQQIKSLNLQRYSYVNDEHQQEQLNDLNSKANSYD